MGSMIEFIVLGDPVSQGSMKAFVIKGRANVVPDNGPKLKKWRKAVADAAREAWKREPTDLPLEVEVWFYRRSPLSKQGNVYDDTGPDGDKLMRAIFDGITKVITTNDARITDFIGHKRFTTEQPRAEVTIRGVDRPLVIRRTESG